MDALVTRTFPAATSVPRNKTSSLLFLLRWRRTWCWRTRWSTFCSRTRTWGCGSTTARLLFSRFLSSSSRLFVEHLTDWCFCVVLRRLSKEQQDLKVALERQVLLNQNLSQEKEQLMFKLRHRESCSSIHLPIAVQQATPRWSHDPNTDQTEHTSLHETGSWLRNQNSNHSRRTIGRQLLWTGSYQVIRWPGDQVTGWSGDRVIRWPGNWVIRWPHSRDCSHSLIWW